LNDVASSSGTISSTIGWPPSPAQAPLVNIVSLPAADEWPYRAGDRRER
jgi:hypothetical protein